MAKVKTAQKILDCATGMFALQGYTGTIMDELAQKCSVNKATIYYHYKDKATLYETVLAGHLKVMVDAIILSVEQAHGAQAKLDVYVARFASHNSKKSFLVSMLMREMASGGVSMPDSAKAQMHRLVLLIKAIITQGVEEGSFMEVDALMVHFMILGSLSFFITTAPIRKTMISTDEALQQSFQTTTVESVASTLSMMLTKALKNEKN